MARWNDTLVKGVLDVTDTYFLSQYKYNLASIVNNDMVIGDSNINTCINGNRIIIPLKDKYTAGTSMPETTNAKAGQIYFRIID